MTKEHFIKQFQFEKWANELIFDAINKADQTEERVFELISHVVISHHIWLKKVLNESPTYKLWDVIGLDNLRNLNNENLEGWFEFLKNFKQDEDAHYINFIFFGNPSKISIHDLLIHLINHSSYHRGQIVSKLKGKLNPLPLTTYIAFATEKN